MSYYATGALRTFTASQAAVATVASGTGKPTAAKIAEMAAKGFEWYEPGGGKAGSWRRKQSATGVRATVTVTERDPESAKCMKLVAAQRSSCLNVIKSGGTYQDFQYMAGCEKQGYAGDALAICMGGRKEGKGYAEIRAALEELAAQAEAEGVTAPAAARKFPTWILLAGGGALALVLLLKGRRK